MTEKAHKAERVFSGTRATGRLHLGNYLGAVKGYIALSERSDLECIYMAVDVHTITTPYDPKTLKSAARAVIADYLAAGLDPERAFITIQSLVPEHTELGFYFSSLVSVARMQHLPTFKDKVKQHPDHVTMALLNYPVLQAADILMYKAGLVPVGVDQEPHLEISREIAKKMNQLYGTDFPEPVRFATEAYSVPSLSGEGKMSKSIEGSYITLVDTPEQIRKKIRSVPTATTAGGQKNAGIQTLFTLLGLFAPAEVAGFEKSFQNGSLRFVELKDRVADLITADLAPIRKRRLELDRDPAYVDRVITRAAEACRDIAQATMTEVRQKMGFR